MRSNVSKDWIDLYVPRTALLARWMAWALAFAYTLAPFEFGFSNPAEPDNPVGWPWLADLLLHAIAFGGVGIVESLATGASRRIIARSVLVQGLVGCVLLEIVQLAAVGRHAAVADLLANAAALALGHVAGARLRDPATYAWSLLRSPHARSALLGLYVLAAATALLLPRFMTTLDGWDRDYPLLIGNERSQIDSEGPWTGDLQYVAIYGKALEAKDVARLYRRPPEPSADTRAMMDLLAGYDFSHPGEEQINPTGLLESPELHLLIPPGSTWTALAPRSLRLQNNMVVGSAAAARSLTDAVATSGSFTVEVWCRPDNVTQTGPARIVGISDSIWHRNFTLAQDLDTIHFRVRNAFNGSNGLRYELRVPRALTTDLLQIVATYDQGVSRVFVNGEPRGAPANLRLPAVLLGLGTRPSGSIVAVLLGALTLLLILKATRS